MSVANMNGPNPVEHNQNVWQFVVKTEQPPELQCDGSISENSPATLGLSHFTCTRGCDVRLRLFSWPIADAAWLSQYKIHSVMVLDTC